MAEGYEVRVSPNGRAVAIKNELPGVNDWSVMTVDHGGHHTTFKEVADWETVRPI